MKQDIFKPAAKIILFVAVLFSGPLYAKETGVKNSSSPLTINADNVEYGTDTKNVTATGNVEVLYQGTKLTCRKLTVNTENKEGFAEGNVRLESDSGVIEGEGLHYNFQGSNGFLKNAVFRAYPYFGKARNIEKVNESQFIAFGGYTTTCSFDHPHYRIKSKRIDVFPGNKVQTKSDTFLFGDVPVASIPYFNQSFQDPLMHVQVSPGHNKNWGYYMLSAWRVNLAENVTGQIYFDARSKLGLAEGFGTNYSNTYFGKGSFKFYYTKESATNVPAGTTDTEFQRYLVRWRHKWDIDNNTNLVAEYYDIKDEKRVELGSDYSFLKDYFSREFEKDAQPPSYVQVHHAFHYASLDFLMQQKTNSWYDPGYLERLPELKFSMPSYKIGDTPFYFENESTGGTYNLVNSSSTPGTTSTPNVHVNRMDTTNKFSIPEKIAFIQLAPFVSSRQTFYSEGLNGSSISPRTIFSSGTSMSTKFFRIFDVKNNFLGMDINGLRHVITPSIDYNYSHTPTVLQTSLKQIDDVDAILTSSNTTAFTLSNKLQTKRNGASVDFVDFLVSSSYSYKPKGQGEGKFSDYLCRLIFIPYSWVRIDADTTYNHSGLSWQNPNYNSFSNFDLDANFTLGNGRSFGFGQNYLRKGGNSLVYNFNWRLNPKWSFSLYERLENGSDPTLEKGLVEEEYTVTRNLHCWDVSLTYNKSSGQGASVFLLFRLKAFPELNFNMNQSYHKPTTSA
ncbi:MAG: LptA/OstA family protein [Candidatus Omnitrophota bacterium]|jgi:lipopolysaccharide assembly outer membrane protein LptD (OstA)